MRHARSIRVACNHEPPRSIGMLGALAAGLAACSAANAQNLEEIIVTAERREMSLQDTPISVIAFSGETLEYKGVRDMFELAGTTPNLDIKGSRGTGNTSPNYQIRGIGGGGGATGERGVGFYIDNVFMPRTTGPVMRVLDVERVEVLRGPQGTLFGRNSTGGAIRVFSRQPTAERDGYLKLTGGNFDHRDVSAMVNVPITDQLYFRAQAASLEQDGFVRRGPQMLGESDDTVVRLQAAWHPSDTLSVTTGFLRTDSESTGSPTDMVQFNMAPACPSDPANPFICWEGNYADWMSDFLEQSGQPRLQHNDPRLVLDDFTMPDFCFLDGPDPDWDDLCLQWSKNDYTQLDVNVNWEISDRLTMISTTGLSEFSSDSVSDWQLLGMEFRRDRVESEVFYQEFQFNLELFDGKVDFVTGFNYFNEDSESPRGALYNAVGSSTFSNQTANGNLWGCVVGGSQGPFCSSGERRLRETGDSYTLQKSEAYGLFANATWHLSDRIDLTLGVRESYDKKDFLNTLFASDNFIPEDGVSATVHDKDDWQETDWRSTLDIQITNDLMVYVTASQAFRSGTFSVQGVDCATPLPPGPPQPCPSYQTRRPSAPVPPEILRNDEVGMRSEWLGGRLRANVTYFDMNFTNRQGASQVPDPNSATGFSIRLVNQGDVDLDGMEIETQFAVTDRLTLDASAGWVDYVMEAPCVNNGIFLFPPPVDRSVTFGGRYEIPAGNGGNFSLGFNFTRMGPQETHSGGLTPEQFQAFGCTPQQAIAMAGVDSRYRLDGYEVLNAMLRYTSSDGRWSAGLYGNNLTDETYGNNAQAFGRGYWGAGGPVTPGSINEVPRNAIAEYRARPREFGITFQYNFFN